MTVETILALRISMKIMAIWRQRWLLRRLVSPAQSALGKRDTLSCLIAGMLLTRRNKPT